MEAEPPAQRHRPNLLHRRALEQRAHLGAATRINLTSVDQALLALYARLAGCDATLAAIRATDGLVVQDVMDAAARGVDIGEQAPIVCTARTVAPADLRDAVFVHGSVFLGVTLHQADVQPGGVWRGGVQGAGDPVTGHAILLWGYRRGSWRVATWGETMDPEPDDAWVASRFAEAFVLDWRMAVAENV